MSKNTVAEASADTVAEAVESAGTGSVGKPKRAHKAAPKARKTRGSGASKSAGSTRKGSATGNGNRTPKEGARKAAAGRKATRKADAKGVEGRKRPGPAPRPLKPGEAPTPMAKPMDDPKAAANAGPAVEAALAFFDGSRQTLADYLGIQSQNLGRILRSHRAGWAERIPDKFVPLLASVAGMQPSQINPFVFRPEWKVPKVSKAMALERAAANQAAREAADAAAAAEAEKAGKRAKAARKRKIAAKAAAE